MKNILRRLLRRQAPSRPKPERYALNSGERQTATTLDGVRFDHVARYQLAARLIAEHYRLHRPAFGLDAFCGTGYGTRLIADQIDCPVLGIDASSEAIALANTYFSSTTTLFSVKIFPLSLPRATFDFIVCLESIEHVAQAGGLVDTLAQSLKPGGLLVVSTPNSERWSLALNPNPFHHCHYTQQQLIDLAERDGRLSFTTSYAQDLYHFEAGRIVRPLAPEAMQVRHEGDGQILILAFTRRA